ncbi:hypothetical protein PVMG_05932 [Plasmodium vivax Mauritania I]|uniref:Uncharacterized protein n=1 Tax=Plasmodium vivax Mauritania I TaxID=1035515 RepID=A0A0J9T4T3_PLAVI|nr:hypothetical protein PVMG_05932 [Plasmodium vivax Mauritania I]
MKYLFYKSKIKIKCNFLVTHDFLLSDELNSENFYKHLNHLEILEECSSYCKPLHKLDRGGSVKNICARTLSYLKIKYSTLDNQNDEYDVCTLLNYWLYNRLNIVYNYGSFYKVIQAFGQIQSIWSDFIHKGLNKHNPKICNPIFDIAIQRDWKERKKLLDYCNNAKHLLIIANSHSGACNKYYQYIESKSDLYKQYEQACNSDNKNMCPKFFNACKDYNPEKVLPTLTCHPDMEKRRPAASAIAMRGDGKNPLSPDSEADSADFSQLQRGDTPTVTKAGNVLLGVVITSMTSGALYRYYMCFIVKFSLCYQYFKVFIKIYEVLSLDYLEFLLIFSIMLHITNFRTEPYVKSSKLYSLISRLNDTKHEKCHKYTLDHFVSVEITQKETLKNIVSSVVCGYNYLTIFVDETLTDLCKYLNLWLDEQKGKHVIDEPDVSKEDWQAVENLWERLKGEKDADHQCKRQHTEKTTSEYSKRIDLMSYCINRDYFKNLFHSSGVSESYNANICEVFSNYINENYEKLIRDINCIDKKSDIKDYKYHISEDCTLYDIPRTFPKCKAHGPTFVENDNSKENIIKCETTTEVKSARTESTGSLAGPAETYDSLVDVKLNVIFINNYKKLERHDKHINNINIVHKCNYYQTFPKCIIISFKNQN